MIRTDPAASFHGSGACTASSSEETRARRLPASRSDVFLEPAPAVKAFDRSVGVSAEDRLKRADCDSIGLDEHGGDAAAWSEPSTTARAPSLPRTSAGLTSSPRAVSFAFSSSLAFPFSSPWRCEAGVLRRAGRHRRSQGGRATLTGRMARWRRRRSRRGTRRCSRLHRAPRPWRIARVPRGRATLRAAFLERRGCGAPRGFEERRVAIVLGDGP